MALTVSVLKRHDLGITQRVLADITFDSSYASGGESLTGTLLGMRIGELYAVQAAPKAGMAFEFVPNANNREGLLKAYRAALRNAALSTGGVAIGTTKQKIKTATTVNYLLDGVFKTKAATDDLFVFTDVTHDIAADASTVQEAVYALSLDAAGAATVTKGTTATGSGNAAPPAAPVGKVLVGYVRIAVAAGATPFNATGDALDAAHLTVTYTNAALPADGGKALGALAEAELREVAGSANLSGLTVRVEALGR